MCVYVCLGVYECLGLATNDSANAMATIAICSQPALGPEQGTALELTETGTEKLELVLLLLIVVVVVVRTVGCIWLTLLSILPSFAFAALRASLKGGRMQSRQPASSTTLPLTTHNPPHSTPCLLAEYSKFAARQPKRCVEIKRFFKTPL